MQLALAILINDNDIEIFKTRLLKRLIILQDKVDIIVIDNTTIENNIYAELSDFAHLKYFKFGYNSTQISGRKKAIELCESEYCWFLDGDDDMSIDLQNLFKVLTLRYYDIVCCNFEEKSIINGEQVYLKASDCTTVNSYARIWNINTFFEKSYPPLWNKIIKTSVLKKAEKYINYEKGITNEDTIRVLISAAMSKTCFYLDEALYTHYHGGLSTTPHLDVDQFKMLITGLEDSLHVFNDFNFHRHFKKCNKKKIFSYMFNFLFARLYSIPNEKEKRDCEQLLFTAFSQYLAQFE